MDLTQTKKTHSILIENKEKLTITGVTDVEQFDPDHLVAQTDYGQLEIRGENLQVTRLSLETGDMCAEGVIDAVSYAAVIKGTGGLFSRVFR